jgi:SAM-dependent methyltransferase
MIGKSHPRDYKSLFPGQSVPDIIRTLYRVALRREPGDAEVDEALANIENGRGTLEGLFLASTLSSEFMDLAQARAAENHLLYIHNTRIKLIKFLLPPANVILDIGGANGSMLDYGYPHPFQKLILTDLPQNDRIPELQAVDLERKWKHAQNIEVVYTSMTDLSSIESESIDLVWVGQVVEHLHEWELELALKEIRRVLKNQGCFCFDTPNAILTRIHSPDQLIHPEHKKEWTPDEMRRRLSENFVIEQELGLIPMPNTFRTRSFSYEEMVLNNGFSDTLDHCYLMYFKCRKET